MVIFTRSAVLSLLLAIASSAAGQTTKRIAEDHLTVKGLEGSFGIYSATLKSDIPELDQLPWIAEGGKIVYVTGNDLFVSKVGSGFYYSAASVPQTVDLFYTELSINFYPLSLTHQRLFKLNPYLQAGGGYSLLKMGGTYLRDDTEPQNMSVVDETYIGRINQLNVLAGVGFDYRIIDAIQFLHLFCEALWGRPLISDSSTQPFKNTTTGSIVQVHTGVRFGLRGQRNLHR